MKWIVRLFALLVLVVVALAGYAVATARGSDRPVGFQTVRATDAQGRPISIGLWYPTSATPRPTTLVGVSLLKVAPDGPVLGRNLPLVAVSHGNGGGVASHADLAMDLASAGYVVAAPMHPGDNYADQSAAGSTKLFSDRAQQLRTTVDYVLGRWDGRAHVDPNRVGLYGMSAGAFSVLTLVGGNPDMTAIPAHCAKTPEFICEVLRHAKSDLLADPADAGPFAPDPRIRAAVIAAPGLGFTFAPDGLAGVRVPVQLWAGDEDETVPYATNAGIVRNGLGSRVEFHSVPGARHISFLAPCGLLKPPAACEDAPGFDRTAFHSAMNAEVIAFFDRHLPRG